jgi:hypothetical protein
MGDDKISEVVQFLNFHFKHFWSTNLNPNLVESKNIDKLY